MEPLHLDYAELLCSKVCHDLIGSVTGISTGMELISESYPQDEVIKLIQKNVTHLVAKLDLFRSVFGRSGRQLTLHELTLLLNAYFHDRPLSLTWPPAYEKLLLLPGWTRLIACTILWISDALPRGGKLVLDVKEDPGCFVFQTQATCIALKDEHLDILTIADFDPMPHPIMMLPLTVRGLCRLLNANFSIVYKKDQQLSVEISGDFKQKLVL